MFETKVNRRAYLVRKISDQSGVAMVLVMGFALILSLASSAFMGLSGNEMRLARVQNDTTRTFYAAQAGIEHAIAGVQALYATGNVPVLDSDFDVIQAPAMAGYTFTEFDISFTAALAQDAITDGPFTGMQAALRPISITVSADSLDTGRTVRLTQTLQSQFIGLFQFGIFYYEDLVISPLPTMTFEGAVHSNNDIYVASSNGVSFDSRVTTSADIRHELKGPNRGNINNVDGDVTFMDAGGVYQSMQNPDDTWLDSNSTNPDWATESQTRWDGRVRSGDHAVNDIELAFWPSSIPPHEIIERGDVADSAELQAAKFYYKADLRILDGVAYDINDNVVNLTYEDPPGSGTIVNPLDVKTFYNAREQTNVQVTEVDLQMLQQSGQMPANGVLYVSDTRGSGIGLQDGVRLANGDELPVGGLTVVTDNPMYILGDYNTVNKKPAAVINDAVTILSNAWDDADSSDWVLSRDASDTTVQTAVMTGNKLTEGVYQGGVENLPRFLEDWGGQGGQTFTYRGSLVDLWESEQATGDWGYVSEGHYRAPVRVWSYDTDFSDPANAPPGIPFVYNIQRIQWQYDDM